SRPVVPVIVTGPGVPGVGTVMDRRVRSSRPSRLGRKRAVERVVFMTTPSVEKRESSFYVRMRHGETNNKGLVACGGLPRNGSCITSPTERPRGPHETAQATRH